MSKVQKYSKFSIFASFEGEALSDVLTLYGVDDKGDIGCYLGCTVFKLKLKSGFSKLFIISSAAEIISHAIKYESVTKNPKKWIDHCDFQLIVDDKSAVDYNYINLKFHHFHEPQAPFIRRIVSNMFMNGLSPGIIGYSTDSSKKSLAPDIEVFMKKSLGVAVFQLEKPELDCIVDCVEIDSSDLPEFPVSIGDSVLMYGSGFNVYSPEYFSMAVDKGYISQIIGHGESYLCNMNITGASQCYPIWKEEDDSLIGIKLPVFVNHKNMYTYSFILSIRCLINSLTYGSITIPEFINDRFSVISQSIVMIRAGGHYGTGVIIHPAGYVLTNRHVVENDQENIVVNEEFNAKVFCCSKGLYDLALIKMMPTKRGNQPSKPLPPFKILIPYTGRPKIDLKDEYYTTGYGMWSIIQAPAFCKGYLRKLVMHTDNQGNYRCQFVAHSCDLYDGSSGGPLINSIGQVVGINFQNIKYNYFEEKKTKTIIYSKLGFAISHEVFSEIYTILFNEGLTEEEKQEFIQGHYCMSYQGKPLLN
ncbi:unnamed protein product [Moneuplotes crassus]|uniref:Peroxisomal leader peptide-processing protease n=1 Tax=Euplotes crassus TaxID=5936 RepID=A0AAD1U1U1_EUPCR|nr:unnamed protein product [Moneuplotes crassus]